MPLAQVRAMVDALRNETLFVVDKDNVDALRTKISTIYFKTQEINNLIDEAVIKAVRNYCRHEWFGVVDEDEENQT